MPQTYFFEKFYSHIVWPAKRSLIKEKFLANPILEPARKIGYGESIKRNIKGEFESSKMQATIQYESGIELKFIKGLEKSDKIKYYMSQPPTFIQYFDDNNKRHRYYPDFFAVLDDLTGVIIEMKGDIKDMSLYETILKWEALHEHCAKHGLGYCIAKNNGKYLQYYLQKEVDLSYTQEILSRLSFQSLNYKEYSYIAQQYSIKLEDFVSLVLQNNLKQTTKPWLLEKNSKVILPKI